MLPKKYRAIKKDAILPARLGKSVHGDYVTVRIGEATAQPRVVVVVSKKTTSSAVARNTLKRRMREIILVFLKNNPHPATYMVFFKKSALQASFFDLKEDIARILKKHRFVE